MSSMSSSSTVQVLDSTGGVLARSGALGDDGGGNSGAVATGGGSTWRARWIPGSGPTSSKGSPRARVLPTASPLHTPSGRDAGVLARDQQQRAAACSRAVPLELTSPEMLAEALAEQSFEAFLVLGESEHETLLDQARPSRRAPSLTVSAPGTAAACPAASFCHRHTTRPSSEISHSESMLPIPMRVGAVAGATPICGGATPPTATSERGSFRGARQEML